MKDYDAQFSGPVCGIDEVGRGPLAGPVMAAAVIIPPATLELAFWDIVTDSKKLSSTKREKLYDHIIQHCHTGIGTATCEDIDKLNIHKATLLAMSRAYNAMAENIDAFARPQTILIDGKFIPALPESAKSFAVIKGDGLSLSIAAASIIAKVTRDRLMIRLGNDFPHYGWERNAGYGTAEHLQAIAAQGITEHHRRSFAPIKNIIENTGTV